MLSLLLTLALAHVGPPAPAAVTESALPVPDPTFVGPPAAESTLAASGWAFINSGFVFGNIDINATPNPLCTGTIFGPGGPFGTVTFELLPPVDPTHDFGPIQGTIDYTPLGTTTTFYAGSWRNFDGTLGAVGQTGTVYAIPIYQPFPPIDPGDNVMRFIFEWKVPSGGLGGGPWIHYEFC